MTSFTNAQAKQLGALWTGQFPDVTVVAKPNQGDGSLVLQHTSHPHWHLKKNAIYRVRADHGRYHNWYEIILPSSLVGAYTNALRNQGFSKIDVHPHVSDYSSSSSSSSSSSVSSVHHHSSDYEPSEFSRRTMQAWKSSGFLSVPLTDPYGYPQFYDLKEPLIYTDAYYYPYYYSGSYAYRYPFRYVRPWRSYPRYGHGRIWH